MIAVLEGGGGRFFRAFDKITGEALEIEPFAARPAPMTYLAGGKQYVALPVGGRSTRVSWWRWPCRNGAAT